MLKKLHLLLITLFFTFAANAQMVLVYEIPNAGDSIALPLNGTVDVTVDWGDGSQEYISTTGYKWHVFETEGVKTVTVTGNLTHFGFIYSDFTFTGSSFLTKVISWDGLGITSFKFAFNHALVLTEVPATLPETVTDLTGMFHKALTFNENIGAWNTGNIEVMQSMFAWAELFNQNIDDWNTENVTNMIGLFYNAKAFNQPLNKWNTSNVTNMSNMFHEARSFNQPIDEWNTSSVTDMSYMFHAAVVFNQEIGEWDTKNVTNMGNMFNEAREFNQDISKWDTENVTNMGQMFYWAHAFNQPIGDWNTSKVESMLLMFSYNDAFNQPIENWNTSSVTNMGQMFIRAYSFNQPLGKWDISSVTNMGSMFSGASLCTENYDATLNGWASQTVQEGVEFDGGDSKYTVASEATRATLAKSWTITDGGLGTTEDGKCAEITEEELTSVENFSTTSTLEIYPNPVEGKLYIIASSLSSYSIYNLTGNLIKKAEVQGSEVEIELSDFPTGVYILQTTSEAGVQTQRFTKQ